MIKVAQTALPDRGMHLIAPLYNVEDDIIKVTATPPRPINQQSGWQRGRGNSREQSATLRSE